MELSSERFRSQYSSFRDGSRVTRHVSGGGKGVRPPEHDRKGNDGLEKTTNENIGRFLCIMPSFEESFKFTKYYACRVSDRWGGREAVVVDTYLFEIGRQCLSVNSVAVILRSDMHSSSGQIQTWDVVGAITPLSC